MGKDIVLAVIGPLGIVINYILLLVLGPGHFVTASNLFLHLGAIVAIFGLMLAWAL